MAVSFVEVSLNLAKLFEEAGLKHRPRISMRFDTEEDLSLFRTYLRKQFLETNVWAASVPNVRSFYTAGIPYETS